MFPLPFLFVMVNETPSSFAKVAGILDRGTLLL